MSAHEPFWENANELRAFMRYLYLHGWFDSEQGMLTFLEKPWKYRPEYREYLAHSHSHSHSHSHCHS
jgi:hypothetical protein